MSEKKLQIGLFINYLFKVIVRKHFMLSCLYQVKIYKYKKYSNYNKFIINQIHKISSCASG